MALTPRKIYDATGVAYHVGVEPNASGDIQAFCLYSADGSPITPLSSGDSIAVVPGDNFVEGILPGTDLSGNDKYGVIVQVRDGSDDSQDLRQPLTASELALAAIATEGTSAALLVEMRISSGAMAMLYDDAGGGVAYQGWAEPGTATSAASWRLCKVVESSGDFTITWADGDRSFNNVWDNRATTVVYS